MTITVNAKELASILAGLRMVQHLNDEGTQIVEFKAKLVKRLETTLNRDGGIRCSNKEIDELAARIAQDNEDIEDLVNACRRVIKKWPTGELAEAVNGMDDCLTPFEHIEEIEDEDDEEDVEEETDE